MSLHGGAIAGPRANFGSSVGTALGVGVGVALGVGAERGEGGPAVRRLEDVGQIGDGCGQRLGGQRVDHRGGAIRARSRTRRDRDSAHATRFCHTRRFGPGGAVVGAAPDLAVGGAAGGGRCRFQ